MWNKTNRLEGKMLFAAGAIGAAGAFLPDDRWKMWVLFVPIAVAALVPCVMSYVWFRKTGK